jgi:hypothetical protein
MTTKPAKTKPAIRMLARANVLANRNRFGYREVGLPDCESPMPGIPEVCALGDAVAAEVIRLTVAVPLVVLLKSTVLGLRGSADLIEQVALGAVVVQER